MICVFYSFIQETFFVPILCPMLRETVWDGKVNETPQLQQAKCIATVKLDIELTHYHRAPTVTVMVGGVDRNQSHASCYLPGTHSLVWV